MLWVYVLLLTAGVVAIVPTLVRAVDGLPGDSLMGAIGFGGLFSGVVGLILRFGDLAGSWTFAAAIAVGLGAAALHQELVQMLRSTTHESEAELPPEPGAAPAAEAEPESDRGGFRIDKPQSTRRPS